MEKQHSREDFRPDFLITPYIVKSDEELRPSDGDIFAVVYWFEKMKDGRCTAGNDAIATIAMCSQRAVQGALERMEKRGYLMRIFFDKERKQRSHIKTLVGYSKISPGEEEPIIEERGIEMPAEENPGQIAREFFMDHGSSIRKQIAEEISRQTGANVESVIAELKKFILYWTEPNKSGTKQRWQLEKTFEVKRRIYTWLSRSQVKTGAPTRSGAGVEL